MAVSPADVQATFCATLVDEWIAHGVRHAVVAPGSRSTPMALALAERREASIHVFHDERSAAFAALGVGLATGVPAALLCTSGTAATHFHAAVVEADLAGVPMLVLTADRPPELHGVGAPQTIDQQHLYGGAPRAFLYADLPEHSQWRGLARRVWALATTPRNPGPVHLNLPFREPLLGVAGTLPPPESPWPPETVEFTVAEAAVELVVTARRGVVVAGRGVDDPVMVGEFAQRLGWPVLADPRSGCRPLGNAIGAFDSLLRSSAFADAHRPDVVVHLGEPPASKVLGQWLAACGARHVQALAQPRTIDPAGLMDARVVAPPAVFCNAVLAHRTSRAADPGWEASWRRAEAAAQRAFDAAMSGALTEPMVARVLTSGALPPGTRLVVASSMPIRDVEWFGGTAEGVTVHANRGANGIDGVLATGIGVAAGSGDRTVVLLGDVALCHDASSLTALAGRGLPLTIVVLDNDGGGIFSFLPQAEGLGAERFEQLFGTPHGTDLEALARAHGIPACTVATAGELRAALGGAGASLIRVATDRTANVAAHEALHAAAAPRAAIRAG